VADIAIENAEDALTFLRTVYQHPKVPLPVRMRAAAIAIEYEKPRLAVTALVAGGNFAELLEQAIERSSRVQAIERSRAQVIEHSPAVEEHPPSELLPKPRRV